MRRNGFTRMELMAVISGSALLLALLIPAMGRAAGAAGSVACREKLAGLNRALGQYCADNQEFFPTSSPASYQAEWMTLVAPYTGMAARQDAPATPFICPEDPAAAPLTYADLKQKKSSYGINGYGVCWNHATGAGVRRSQVKNPDMILLTDAKGWLVVAYAGEGPARIPVPRHENGKVVNVLFFSGSVDGVEVAVDQPADIYNEENLPPAYWNRVL